MLSINLDLVFQQGLGSAESFQIRNQTLCFYHNSSFGFATKARVYKGAGQEGSPGITSHALESVGECEGMNPHTSR
jgi:hypothetical protein